MWWLLNPPRIPEQEIRAALPGNFVPSEALGEVLFHIGGCADCHRSVSDNAAIDGMLAGGVALPSFAGTFYSPNISPDVETGIGSWDGADFINAMTKGIGPSGTHYYAAFPYTSYAKVTYADLLHLKSYLDAQPAVRWTPPGHELAFPFNIRIANGIWKALYLDKQQFEPDPTQSEAWNRGAYIVNGLGHCGVCHTPRNMLFAEIPDQAFKGAPPVKEGEESAPRIAGLGEDEILNGLSEWSGAVSEDSAMFLVTQAFTNHIPFEDGDAVAAYLSSLPGE